MISRPIVYTFTASTVLLPFLGGCCGENPKASVEVTIEGAYSGSVRETADGGFIFASAIDAGGANGQDAYLMKTDASLQAVWSKAIGGADNESAQAVRSLEDGGYVIAGNVDAVDFFQTDVFLVRTDGEGNTLWTKTFGDTEFNIVGDVEVLSDSGFIIAASAGQGYDDQDFYLIRTDSAGNTVWAETYKGDGNDVPFSVRETSDGGFIVAGNSGEYHGFFRAFVFKTDLNGSLEWTRSLGNPESSWSHAVELKPGGGYAVAGGEWRVGARLWFLHEDGTVAEEFHFGGGDQAEVFSGLAPVASGGYIAVGATGGFCQDLALVRISPEGQEIWSRRFGGVYSEAGYSVVPTSTGGFVAAGYSSAGAYLVKTDANGN